MQDSCEILFTIWLYNSQQYIKLSPLENAMFLWTSTYRTDQGYLQNSTSGLLCLMHDVITLSDEMPYDKVVFFLVLQWQ